LAKITRVTQGGGVILNLFQQSTNAKNLCGSWCARVKKNCEYVLLTQDRYIYICDLPWEKVH